MKKIYKTISMDRKQIYDEVWTAPLTILAKKYSLNYTELTKALSEANVPYPASGYWLKKSWGKTTEKDVMPLLESEKDTVELPILEYDLVETEIQTVKKWSDSILQDMDSEKRKLVLEKAETIRFDPDMKLHETLVEYKKGLSMYKSGGNGRSYYGKYSNGQYRDRPYFVDEVSYEGIDRAILIMNNLFKAIEELGDSICDYHVALIGKDRVAIWFKETTVKTDHIPTKQEEKALEQYRKDLEKGRLAFEPKINKYDYGYSGRLRFSFYGDEKLYDTKTIRLEDRLGEMLIMIYEKAEKERKYREREEEYDRRAELRRQKRKQEHERRVNEAERIHYLLNEAADYKIACNIREYIAAVINKKGSSADPDWIKWANEKADWYDPMVDVKDPILGERIRDISEDQDDLSEYTKEKSYSIWDEDDYDDLLFDMPW